MGSMLLVGGWAEGAETAVPVDPPPSVASQTLPDLVVKYGEACP
ncbi:hypothetical protein [Streptosporangium sp. NPDC000396]